jgi:serine/threonine protein kinase
MREAVGWADVLFNMRSAARRISGLDMPKIFISYRREDTPGEAAPIRDRLASHFGHENVFIDFQSIPLGGKFPVAIREKLAICDYLLALIGRSWLSICDANGRRRLDDPEDWVCREIGTALERGIPVIGVLLHDVAMPRREELPDAIKELADRQSISVRALAGFNQDLDGLIADIAQQEDDRSKRTRKARKALGEFDVRAETAAAPPAVDTSLSASQPSTATQEPVFDAELAGRLPTLLAQLYADAVYAKSALERYKSAFFLWEATIKLMGGTEVVSWAARAEANEEIAQLLKTLARPELRHWWGYCTTLLPRLANSDPDFSALSQNLLGSERDDLPRLAGLDALLREAAGESGGARAFVHLQTAIDRLVVFRTQEIDQGVRRSREFSERIGRALLAASVEFFRKLDPLAGHSLVFFDGVRDGDNGDATAGCLDLRGECPRPARPSLTEPEVAGMEPNRIYLRRGDGPPQEWFSFSPLAAFDADSNDLLLLNGRPKDRQTEYLSYRYAPGEARPDLPRLEELFSRLLRREVSSAEVREWADAVPSNSWITPSASRTTSRTIGDFELLTRLGKGAMGVVYRARQAILGREVALKCQLRVGDALADQRFQREIRALGRVSHPNLVRVYASGNDGDQCYYAMELVEGATLATFCGQLESRLQDPNQMSPIAWRETLSLACDQTRREEEPLVPGAAPAAAIDAEAEKPMTVEVVNRDYVSQIVELIRQSAEAAHALHRADVVHRDIKPGNIMVSADGRQAYLMDLGLAHLIGEGKGKLTRTRQFIGSFPYASPEQVVAPSRVDQRSDVYNLGATLWELLTLRHLFDVTDETPSNEIVTRIQFDPPVAPRNFNRTISRDLEAVILRCLEKSPARRYATAREVAEDLTRVLGKEPISRHGGMIRAALRKSTRVMRKVRVFLPYLLVVTGLGFWLASHFARSVSLQAYRSESGDLADGASNALAATDIERNRGKRGTLPSGDEKRQTDVGDGGIPRLRPETSIMLSCSRGQFSFESRNLRHGVFFYYVIKGLRGEAANEHGNVTWDDLCRYTQREVGQKVGDLFGRDGGAQTPMSIGNLASAMVLTRRNDLKTDGSEQSSDGEVFHRKLAFLVGVAKYESRDLRDLEFTETDVIELGRLLKESGYEVVVWTTALGKSDPSLAPTAANIRSQLSTILRNASSHDLVLFCFSGYGIQPLNGDESFICPADANPTIKDGRPIMPNTLLGLQELQHRLSSSGARCSLFLIDGSRNDPDVR